jgi:hypothetical protein
MKEERRFSFESQSIYFCHFSSDKVPQLPVLFKKCGAINSMEFVIIIGSSGLGSAGFSLIALSCKRQHEETDQLTDIQPKVIKLPSITTNMLSTEPLQRIYFRCQWAKE